MSKTQTKAAPAEASKTITTKHQGAKTLKKTWVLLDAKGRILGDVAAKAAHILRGKHKTSYTPNMDDGDFVVIVNADKVEVSGKKRLQKQYHFHSGYVGNIKSVSLEEMLQKKPAHVLELAVKGMIKRSRLGREQLRNLRVYAGSEHPHASHNPVPVAV